MDGPTDRLMRQFLAWAAAHPRTYEQAMDAWRSSCPRSSVWEDALADGLIRLDIDETVTGARRVVVTLRGMLLLDGA
jgi:hypothetical protein